MKFMYVKTLSFALFLLIGVNTSTVNAAAICGPGPNWVADCTQGTDVLSISIAFGLTSRGSGLAEYTAVFEGQMVVERSSPYSSDTSPSPDYLDRIDTKILSLTATGTSPEVAGWVLNSGTEFGLSPTLGYIQDLTDSSGALTGKTVANFDLYFEIINTPYGTLRRDPTITRNPYLFFDGNIEEWSGNDITVNHTGCCFGTLYDLIGSDGNYAVSIVDQLDSNGLDIGRPEIIITGVVVPVPASFFLMLSGLAGLAGFGRYRSRLRR